MREHGRCGWLTGCSPLTRSTLCGSESVEREPRDCARSSRSAGVSWSDRYCSARCWRLRTDFGWLPQLTMIAFAPVLFRGLAWFARRPQPIVVRRLGWTELAHAVVFGVLLTAGFGLLP